MTRQLNEERNGGIENGRIFANDATLSKDERRI